MSNEKEKAGYAVLKLLMLRLALLAVFACAPAACAQNVWFDFDFNSRSFVDSARCDWHEYAYNTATTTPEILKKQYDETFTGSKGHLYTAIRSNPSGKSFLDLSESLFFTYYDKEDPFLRDLSSFKYRSTDNKLCLKWGYALNDADYMSVDFQNNSVEIPIFKACGYHSNEASAKLAHKVGDNSEFSISGCILKRKYGADTAYSYKEALGRVEFASFVKANTDYEQISSSSRGEKSTFESFPTGMRTLNAVDYYTDYVKNPLDSDPDAKYRLVKKRGALGAAIFGDFSTRDYENINAKHDSAGIGLKTAYKAADDLTLKIDDAYKKVEFDAESAANFFYDYSGNLFELKLEQGVSDNLLQSLSYNNETRKHKKQTQEDYTRHALFYNALYALKDMCLSLGGGGLIKDYKANRSFYPDSEEWFVLAGFDYDISKTTKFKLQTELAKTNYKKGESPLYSNSVRHTYRAGIEKFVSRYNSLEAAFQVNSEDHENFSENNLEEKTFQFSWLLHY